MDVEHSFTAAPEEIAGAPTGTGQSMRRWRRRGLLLAVVLCALAGVAWYVWLRPPTAPPPTEGQPDRRPVTVAAARVEAADLPFVLDALGTVTPLATVTVRTRIAGHLTRIGFREGQMVRKGDFLAEVDPRPYQAALQQAEGQLSRDEALLRNAEIDLARYRRLVAEDSIARQQLDTQESLVRQLRATAKVNQALVETARLDLDYTRIVSPIEGRVGLRLVDAGNYVQPSDANGIVVVTQITPISVVFTIPEDDLPKVAARLRAGAKLPVEAYDRAGTMLLARGELATIDNRIDTTTGTVKLRATFDNTQERLFANQFVKIRLIVDTIAAATVAPRGAVQLGANGTYVYVVQPAGTVAVRPVTTGTTVGERIHVVSGLSPGETVVTDGIDRLRDGAAVGVTDAPGVRPDAVAEPR